MRQIITLLTDFGTVDGYVGEMKGVLLSGVPDAEIVDITHDIPPQDIERARLVVARVWRKFPPATIHIVVVDPGVGSKRAALAVSGEGRFLLGPDNGVLSPALLASSARSVELPVAAHVSSTFHGRDVFAPAAIALTRGGSLDTLGSPSSSPIVRRTPEAIRRADGAIDGEVIIIDRFGNAVTNLMGIRGGTIEIGPLSIAIRRTYTEVGPGELVALVGSTGFIEIAVRDGSAAQKLGLSRGAAVTLKMSR